MINSMTAFGSGKHEFDLGSVSVELRSINSRYLDLQFRMPDELRMAEIPLREKLMQRLGRGKVDVRLSFYRPRKTSEETLGTERLGQVASQLQAVRRVIPDAAAPSLLDVLAWPDADASNEPTDPQLWVEPCLRAVDQALDQLTEGRAREGARLAESMLEQSRAMATIVDDVETHLPELLNAQRAKLSQKLLETVQNAFPGGFNHISGAELSERIASESSLFALRIDVAEELSRLRSHIQELSFLLAGNPTQQQSATTSSPAKGKSQDKGSIGKRLDFLFQEMNREANTLGSKAGSLDMTHAAIDLKLLIEQMREQAQNIE